MDSNVERDGTAFQMMPFLANVHRNEYIDEVQSAAAFVASIDVEALGCIGISRSLETHFWPAHTIVTFPFFTDLERNNDLPITKARINQSRIQAANVYVHIPFCTGVCEYCAYARIGSAHEERVSEYLVTLEKELDVWARLLGGHLPRACSLFLGGGTPSAIPENCLAQLMEMLARSFGISPRCTFPSTSEVSPETVLGPTGHLKLYHLKSHGISRISMGVQSFSDRVASEVRRRHNGSAAVEAIGNIRDAGFENINIDLMYGLPGQDVNTWIDSLRSAVALGLPSITMHQLKVKAKSQLATPAKLLKTVGWSQRESLFFAYLGKLILEKAGYSRIGVYRFVLDSREARQYNTQEYRMANLLGLGCSSYSFLANCTTYNIFNQTEYKISVNEGRVPLGVGRLLSPRELRTRFLIFGLRCGVSEADFDAAVPDHGRTIADHFPIFDELRACGLIEITSGARYKFSTLGFLFAEEIGEVLADSQPDSSRSV